MTIQLPPSSDIHCVSLLEGVLTCGRVGCDFKLNVAAYGNSRAMQIGHAHISNPQASKLDLLEFISAGHTP